MAKTKIKCIKQAKELRAKGLGNTEIAEKLNKKGYRNLSGNKLTETNVWYMLKRKPNKGKKSKKMKQVKTKRMSNNEKFIHTVLANRSMNDSDKIAMMQLFLNCK